MIAILGLLNFVLFIILIVGIIKPSLILRWSKKPTRIKVFLYWFLSTIVIFGFGFLIIDTSINSNESIEKANKYIQDGKYKNAISTLKKIEKEDSLYQEAQTMLNEADSLDNILTKELERVKELEKTKVKSRCIDVPTDLVKRIESGLNTKGITLRNAKAVKSNDYKSTYFISADMQGSGFERKDDIVTFSVNSLEGSTMILSVNYVAKEFFVYPRADDRANQDGAKESSKCVVNSN